ncbi:MAG: GNAT family N-acetyltransferase [bacterium]|nr:GNAT family N-acetyltransferase [bacterium]
MARADSYRIETVSPGDWRTFLGDASGSAVFSAGDWLGAAAKATGSEAQFLGAWAGEHLVAGVAGVVSGSGWRRRFATPELLPHTGFLFRPAPTDRPAHVEAERSGATSALIQHLQSRYARIHLTHTPALLDTRQFLWAGWDVQPRYTYHIPLPADRDCVWGGFERRTRTAVRKAEKAGYQVEPTADITELRRLYGLVYGGEADAPVHGEILHSMAQSAIEGDLVEGWRCVAPDGETASVVLFARGGNTLGAWVAGADPLHRDSGATSMLYWHVLRDTACTHFDFVGANLDSIAFFKRGFGGELIPYFATEGFGSAALRSVVHLRRALRRKP